MVLPVYPSLVQLLASSANVRSFTIFDPTAMPNLQQLVIDHSVLADSADVPLEGQLTYLFGFVSRLQYFSCNNCSIQVRMIRQSVAYPSVCLQPFPSSHSLIRLISFSLVCYVLFLCGCSDGPHRLSERAQLQARQAAPRPAAQQRE